MKKIVFTITYLLLSLFLLTGCFESEATTLKQSGINYVLDGSSYTVSSVDRDLLEVEIEEKINDIPVSSISEKAFYKCDLLNKVVIPKTVIKIDNLAFLGCSSILEFVVDKDNEEFSSINGDLYDKDGGMIIKYASGKLDEEIKLSNSVSLISSYSFNSSYNLKKIVLPSRATIGSGAFYKCDNLESISLPSVEDFTELFRKPEYSSTKFVPSSLEEIRIISGSEIINESFSWISGLKVVFIGSTIENIENSAFDGCNNIMEFQVGLGNKKYTSYEGNLYSYDLSTLIRYASGKKETKLTTPSFIKEIEDGAFDNSNQLKEIVLNEGLEKIGDEAFSDCTSLEEIYLPSTLLEFNTYPFHNCINLKEINVSSSNTIYKSINGDLYSKDGKKLIRYSIGKNDTEMIIPSSVETICQGAFKDASSLENIVLNENITIIRESSFFNCCNLAEIIIPSSLTTIERNAFLGCSKLKIFIYDTDLVTDWDDLWNPSNCVVSIYEDELNNEEEK